MATPERLGRREPCPCGGREAGADFGTCCAPVVVDGRLARTPEELMRSRYTAFALRDAEHLWRTWHPRTRPDVVGDLGGVTWTSLAVRSATGGEQGTEGTVTFVASFLADDGSRGAVREHSRFARRAGRWFYVDGDELP